VCECVCVCGVRVYWCVTCDFFSCCGCVCGGFVGFVGCDRRKWFVINIFRTYIHDSRAPHGAIYIYICMCVCQGQGCACVSLCRGNLLNETSSDLTNFKQIIYNTQRHRRHAHTHTHRQILRERHAHTQGTVVARKTAHRTPWWVVVVGGRITRRSWGRGSQRSGGESGRKCTR